MTTPLLINQVIQTKVYHIYSAEFRWITDYPGDSAAQALAGAREKYGPNCKVAVITTAVIKDQAYASNNRNTSSRAPGSGPRLKPPTRGLAIIGATVSPAAAPRSGAGLHPGSRIRRPFIRSAIARR